MNLKLILSVFMLSTYSLFGQSVKKCDTAILVQTSEKIGKLSQEEIIAFLSTFGEDCKNNIEFSEWSNELLFTIMNTQTNLTLTTIEKFENKIELDVILEDLNSPLSDIEIKKLISQVNEVNIKPLLKKQILINLNIADKK